MQLYKKEVIYYTMLKFVKTASRSKLIHLSKYFKLKIKKNWWAIKAPKIEFQDKNFEKAV